VRDLVKTASFGVGSFIGVPLTMAGGEVYGSFCCISRAAKPDLVQRDVRLMNMLAELLIEEIDAQHDRDRQRAQLEQLIAVGRITIALQPIVDLGSRRCVGMEALSRFPAGFGTPDVVFAAAHTVGVGLELERLAVRSAFELLPTLRDPIYIGLNLGPAVALQLMDTLPGGMDIPWDRIVLEITEHAAVEDYAELRKALRPMREKGLRVAVDDAGAGYASMQHVVEMRPDIIKVDRTLIDGLARDPARRSVVSAFVLLAYELEATVLAEGVETADDLNAARRLGATSAQGYVIARPSIDPDDHHRWGGSRDLLAQIDEPQV
ncbi:MAG TPA: EAL domain-containing protein, partial [Mycobacteriales bacterium]|nr:EAL domain-containing protein [Mycobacteriales bacterium]